MTPAGQNVQISDESLNGQGVWVSGEDWHGSRYADSLWVYVVTTCEGGGYLILRSFTPNGDGINDTFAPVFAEKGPRLVELMVFNRWGQRLFITKDPNDGWDGTYKGEPLPPEVYGYLLTLRCPDGTSQTHTGLVRLIR